MSRSWPTSRRRSSSRSSTSSPRTSCSRTRRPTPPERLAGVERAIAAAAAASAPFRLRLHGGGGFPRPDRPRTLWLQITDGAEDLAGLARHVDDHLAREEWPRESRPFRAHLT